VKRSLEPRRKLGASVSRDDCISTPIDLMRMGESAKTGEAPDQRLTGERKERS